MGKQLRKKRGQKRGVPRLARQLAYLTRGAASPDVAAIARLSGYGKDTETVSRALKQAHVSEE